MRLRLSALALACAAAALCGQARADEVYTFTGTTTYPGVPDLTITLDVANAAVQAGSFNLATAGPVGMAMTPTYNGDVTDFISFNSSVTGLFTPTSGYEIYDAFQLALTFDPASGDVTSSYFNAASSAGGNATISGTGATASGTWGNDAPIFIQCNAYTNTCPFSGSWTETSSAAPVPEPATFAVLGAGLVGLGVARRRQLRA